MEFISVRYADLVPVSFLYILRENVNKIIDEGLSNVIERHYVNSRRLQTALQKVIGLDLFVEVEEHRLPTVVTVKMPVGINDKTFTKYLSDRLKNWLLSAAAAASLSMYKISI